MDIIAFFGPLATELMSAALGGGLCSACIWAYRRLRDKRIEQRYSLSGEYVSLYSDRVEGQDVMKSDPVTLRQKGLNILADHDDATSHRGWKLKGRIDLNSGHIYGFYKAKAQTDTGLGVFILEQKNPGQLQGIWAGYDFQNKKITHGDYNFFKSLPVKIRKARLSDISKIMYLSSRQLGEGYLGREALESGLVEHFFVAEHDGDLAGFCLARLLPARTFDTYLKGNAYKRPMDIEAADHSGTLGFLQSVATDEKFQKKGIGMKLVEKAMLSLSKGGAREIFSIAWKTDTVHIEPILKKNGFVERARFPGFWHQESLEKNYTCPKCGHPCNCEAILFTKAL